MQDLKLIRFLSARLNISEQIVTNFISNLVPVCLSQRESSDSPQGFWLNKM